MTHLFYSKELASGKAVANNFARYQQFLHETGLPHSYKAAKVWDEQVAQLMNGGDNV